MQSLLEIQRWMKKNKKDLFFINRTDEFLNEYIAPYSERLNWVSGFSGSAGKAIIEQNQAYIFVDGRYTNQAHKQLDKNYFEIKHIQNFWKHLQVYKKSQYILSVDPTLHSIAEVEKIYSFFKNSKIKIDLLKNNPIDLLWSSQLDPPQSKAFIHDDFFAGESALGKINKIQKILEKNFVDYFVLNSLDSIAWLLNIRGNDIDYTPLLFCYLIVPKDGKVELFIDSNKIYPIKTEIQKIANIKSFENISNYIRNLNSNSTIGFDENYTSYYFKQLSLEKKLKFKNIENPCLYLKAIKNSTELSGAKSANQRDGVSIIKFLYWLKNKMVINKTDEIKAANYLFNLRKKNKLFHSLSFDTISAIGPNAALPHYRVNNESKLKFSNNSIYLVDSGAQYKDGTTDITRTIIIGKSSHEQKDRFTRVLKGHIAIAKAEFSHNTKGSQLDLLARKALKEIGCDYDHGTGHGIGSFLGVHEGPQRIAKSQNQKDCFLSPGMILSNEPGYYKEGEYGIRIENLIICCSKSKDSLYFDTISWAPIDIDLIEMSLISKSEKVWLNEYHDKVYKNTYLSLNKEEREWLYKVTRPL